MSDTNRVALARVKEQSFGVVPTSPALQAVPFTSCGLLYDPDTVTSDRIRSDGQITDLILVGVNAGGPINDEFSYGVHDDDIEAVLRSAWVLKPQRVNPTSDSVITQVTASSDTYTVTDTGADFALGHLVVASGFTNSGNNFATPFRALAGSSGTAVVAPSSPGLTDEAAPPAGAKLQAVGFQGAAGDLVAHGTAKTIGSTLLDFTTLGLTVGEWVKPSNFGITAANNGYCRVSVIAANLLSFDIVPAGWADDAGTAVAVKVFFGDYVRNGTTLSTYSYERRFLDHSPVTYEYFRGQGLDQLVINLESKAKITVEKAYLGKDALVTNTRVTTPTDVAVPTGAILNSSANVGQLLEDDAAIGSPNYVMSAKITLKANLRRKTAIGELGCIGLGMGEFDARLELNTYFGDKSIYDKLVSNDSSSFMLPVKRPDENNRGYLFDFPRMKYAKGTPPVEGKNRDVMAPAQAQAIMHETLLYTCHIQRFPYTE